MNSATLSASPDRLQALRALLAEKFPTAERQPAGVLPTGLAVFDAPEGGLRRGSLTEVSGSTGAGALFLEVALAMLVREKCFGALVDGGGTFDPQGCRASALRRLLWVQCADAAQSVKAADLLLRDGNLALVLLDVQMLPLRALSRIPASTWHRLQRVVEPSGTACVVLTPQPMIEGARVRIALPQRWPLAALRQRRRALLAALEARVFVRGSESLLSFPSLRSFEGTEGTERTKRTSRCA
jgi:hypothetical protein